MVRFNTGDDVGMSSHSDACGALHVRFSGVMVGGSASSGVGVHVGVDVIVASCLSGVDVVGVVVDVGLYVVVDVGVDVGVSVGVAVITSPLSTYV